MAAQEVVSVSDQHDVYAVAMAFGATDGLLALAARLTPAHATLILCPKPPWCPPEDLRKRLLAAGPWRVVQAASGQSLASGTVIVCPPNCCVVVQHNRLHLDTALPMSQHLPLDALWTSLAHSRGRRATAVVPGALSCQSTDDGALGLQAIRAAGGAVVAMALCVDAACAEAQPASAQPIDWHAKQLRAVAQALVYPGSLDVRQLQRRVLLSHLARRQALVRCGDPEMYLQLVRRSAVERQALCRDLLGAQTGFFRDSDTFEVLGRHAQALWRKHHRLRVWVPACATGQEAYSVAMCLLDAMPQGACDQRRLEVVATDLDAQALRVASAGHYSAGDVRAVGPVRLRRYFEADATGFRVSCALRRTVCFRRHNALRSGASRAFHLISCRNMLRALARTAQSRLLALLAQALCADGLLVLGASESIGPSCPLFVPVDRGRRIFRVRTFAAAAVCSMQQAASMQPLGRGHEGGLADLPGAAALCAAEIQGMHPRELAEQVGP